MLMASTALLKSEIHYRELCKDTPPSLEDRIGLKKAARKCTTSLRCTMTLKLATEDRSGTPI